MKRTLAILALCLPITARAVTLAWDASPDPGVGGYTLRWGTNSGVYPRTTNVLNVTQFTLANSNLFAGTNFMVVTAYYASGLSSDPSNEIKVSLPPSPRNLRPALDFGLSLEKAPFPTGPWNSVAKWVYADNTNGASAFYRGKVYGP